MALRSNDCTQVVKTDDLERRKAEAEGDVLRHPALAPRDALVAEAAWFIAHNNRNGTPPDDEGVPDLELAARLPDYVLTTKAVRNLASAIRDLGAMS